MAKIPEVLLKSLYVKGSMKITQSGFEFKMKNELGPARIIGVEPLLFDRKPVPMEKCRFVHAGIEARFTDVSPENSVLMRKGEALIVSARWKKLRPGRHILGIHVVVKDMGPVRFTISDRAK